MAVHFGLCQQTFDRRVASTPKWLSDLINMIKEKVAKRWEDWHGSRIGCDIIDFSTGKQAGNSYSVSRRNRHESGKRVQFHDPWPSID